MTTVNMYFLSHTQKEWKENLRFQSIHPTHILKLGQKGGYFTGFYFVSKGRFEEEEGEGVKLSPKACFLFSNLSVVSTHTDTHLIWLQSTGDCERYGWNSAWNQFFYHYLPPNRLMLLQQCAPLPAVVLSVNTSSTLGKKKKRKSSNCNCLIWP